jgi:hypothetical protein
VLGVTQHAHGELALGGSGQLEGAGETLVSLGIVVLQGDLKLDGLDELSLLALDLLVVVADGLARGVRDELEFGEVK